MPRIAPGFRRCATSGDALTQLNPELILHFEPSSEDLVAAVAVRDQLAPLCRWWWSMIR